MVTVAVLIPTKGRPVQAVERVEALLAQAPPAGVRLLAVVAVPEDDLATIEALVDRFVGRILELLVVTRPAGTTAVEGWNRAYELAGPWVDWYVLGADDIVWRDGWLEAALHVASVTGAQVVGLNDGGHTNLDEYAPHYMAHRDFTEDVLGGHIAPPEYQAWWFDREVCERARALGIYAAAWGAVAEHRHPDWGAAVDDETYLEALPRREADRALYMARRAQGVAT